MNALGAVLATVFLLGLLWWLWRECKDDFW